MARSPKEKAVTHRLPEDREVLSAIGTLALRHSQLDNQLKMLIKDLAGVTKEEALDATAREGSRELRDRVRKLAKRRLGEGPALVRLQALLTKSAHVTERRNELLHGVCGTDSEGGPLLIRDEKHIFRRAPTARQIQRLNDEIVKILDHIVQARFAGFLHEALQQKPKLD